jgi:hypothetical protein
MSISCKSLYDDCAREVGTGIGNDRLAASFVRATNRALDELSLKQDLATKYAHISSTSSLITELSSSYEYILYTGIIYNLIRMGHRPSDPKIANLVYEDSTKRWESGIADMIQEGHNALNAADSTDVWGLGYIDS